MRRCDEHCIQQQLIVMSELGSEVSQLSQLTIKIQNCLLKTLKCSQPVIDKTTIQNIRAKIQEIEDGDSVVDAIEYFLFAFINVVGKNKHHTEMDLQKEDYEILEGAVQKAEAEIRKHIRLEQQLKIYMDGLQEKVQQLEKQLQIEAQKYHQLFESVKAIDSEKRQLKKKLKEYEARINQEKQKDPRVLSHKNSKLLSEPSMHDHEGGSAYSMYKMYNERNRITKSKNFIEKSLNLKPNHTKQDYLEKKDLDADINISLKHSPATKKRNQTDKTQLKQMTRTIQLKQNFRKQSRKLLKYSTEKSSVISNKKEARCNSVCH